ncbi:MAG: hypothetical protein IPP74_00040 [Alphaproteobacteria bacterium]|nr:hypothetical protein [Alphaproteobacteria bacterium]
MHMQQGTPHWLHVNGNAITCHEKLKVLNENYLEFKGLFQDILDDAAAMGCDVDQLKQIYSALIKVTKVSL